jgi:hypothetical protein
MYCNIIGKHKSRKKEPRRDYFSSFPPKAPDTHKNKKGKASPALQRRIGSKRMRILCGFLPKAKIPKELPQSGSAFRLCNADMRSFQLLRTNTLDTSRESKHPKRPNV